MADGGQDRIPTDAGWQTYLKHLSEINDIAEHVADRKNLNRRTKDRFLEGVHEKMQSVIDVYRPEGSFRPWCWSVLERYAIDVIRKISKEPRSLDDQVLGDLPAARDSTGETSLPQVDLTMVFERFVHGLNRVILGIDWRYLSRLDIERALAWLYQAELSPSFPWKRLELIEEECDRRSDLLTELNAARPDKKPMTRNALRVRICNALEKLKDGIIRSHCQYHDTANDG